MFPGQTMAGFSVSLTVTVKVQAFVFPVASGAVQVTVVVPVAKADPLAGTQTVATPGQLSVAEAEKVTLLEQVPPEVLTMMLTGQMATGAWVSLTMTVKLQLPTLPQ